MKDLRHFQTPLLVNFPRGQFISRMPELNEDRVVYDLSSNVLDNDLALQSGEVNIIAEAQGAKVEFGLVELQRIDFSGLPAFSAPLPPMLWQIPRRASFRINAPMEPIFYCHTQCVG